MTQFVLRIEKHALDYLCTMDDKGIAEAIRALKMYFDNDCVLPDIKDFQPDCENALH